MTQDTEKSIERETLKLRNSYEQPRAGLETQMADVFSRIMGVTPVGAEDDFYDLGGDSLLGEQISMEILRVTGKVFPISDLFENGTPRAVAAALSGATGETPTESARETFFIVHGRGGYTVPKPGFRAGITSGARVAMLELPGIRGDKPFPRTVADVAKAYVEHIEREQPEGPVRLAAFCTGSLIALEMAPRLKERGRNLETLVLLDPGMPDSLVDRHRSMVLLKESPADLRGRLILFSGTGRLSETFSFLEPLWLRVRAIKNLLDRVKKRKGVPRERLRYGNAGLKDWPRAWLVASYRHAWPRPFDTRCHILASRNRSAGYLDKNGVWQYLLPNRAVHILVERHHDILSGTSAHVAAAMETLLLGGELAGDITVSAPVPASSERVRSAAPAGMTATAAS
ncbi:alpha/beta fold hydrolase [Aquibium sp. ELW1220]|uniref:thioesterase domain-containing protein n=1 Tax=Aquibium sp. ELW1220 TaxID=2976766 RepID=UPI0025B12D04|nr:alpha/beta fold hydrolase [Aquibium sp. ELW1220]MDN2584287.1 thioesterase domain-containing protein [Aquibium sp. ELW1220]